MEENSNHSNGRRQRPQPVNPFYVLLLISGVAFAITACAYGVMTVRQLNASRVPGYRFSSDSPDEPKDFNQMMDAYGGRVMIAELVLLGIGTVGAIMYDQRLDQKLEAKTNELDREHSVASPTPDNS